MTTAPTRVDHDSAGGVRVAAYRWDPRGEPRAIVQIVHGVGEYARRYQPLVEDLLAAGYVVWAHDHRGHGATARSEGEFGILGPGGWAELVRDIGRTGEPAKAAYPRLPLVLVAHSLGSFAAQQYLLDHSADVSAVVLSGTAVIDLLEPAMDLDAPMDLSGFNAPFAPARTDFDWQEMFAAARQPADPGRVAGMREDLPVYVVVGEQDPVNGGLALVHELVRRYEQAGLKDVTLKVWPGARHEVFNETNRDEIVAGVLACIAHQL